MIQVKEFLNYQNGQDVKINEWLKEQKDNIKIIEIKYSVGTFQESNGCGAQEYSGVLIVYKAI